MTKINSYEEILKKFNEDPEFRTRLITQTEAVLKEYGMSIPEEQLQTLGLPQKEVTISKPMGFVFSPSIILYSGTF
ncbi:hypothetical protein [Acinetobacter indicus]|uniref:hypothetical protein n=1 Tax=Acinetobacter indicus TaxID=756892 RepID=UPI002577FF37|nr:hypothetical protein [Acinetobacter indicus]MDM1274677.1 hypothetical protein [Acinetobacter indicus]MDM1300310.1 hypothetical protein [Acinetobacter indicus]